MPNIFKRIYVSTWLKRESLPFIILSVIAGFGFLHFFSAGECSFFVHHSSVRFYRWGVGFQTAGGFDIEPIDTFRAVR
jgi:hypothetical protein